MPLLPLITRLSEGSKVSIKEAISCGFHRSQNSAPCQQGQCSLVVFAMPAFLCHKGKLAGTSRLSVRPSARAFVENLVLIQAYLPIRRSVVLLKAICGSYQYKTHGRRIGIVNIAQNRCPITSSHPLGPIFRQLKMRQAFLDRFICYTKMTSYPNRDQGIFDIIAA